MGFEDLIRSGVALASSLLETMKGDVMHEAWIGENGAGLDDFAAPVARRAIIDLKKALRAMPSGRLVMTYATLTFLDPIPDTTPNSGKVRENPIDPRDHLVLPDGGTAPIVQSGGPFDSGTTRPFIQETVLGTIVKGSA